MSLRTRCTSEQHDAHRVLDLVRAGVPQSEQAINRALAVLGDLG